VSPSSAKTLTADLTNISTQLTKLHGQGSAQFMSAINQVSSSVAQIEKAAAELSTNPTAAVQSLTTALTGLKGKVQPAVAQMNSACPQSGASSGA
jgi:hypothetical protein